MIGSVLGNYKIVAKIGEGGMGAVYKGVDLMLEREVAIKALRPELAAQPNIVERFRTEAITLAKLNHPNIAALYSFFRQENEFFMVMEYMEGITLDDSIHASGAISYERAVPLFAHALEGVGYAHRRGIIHRDIKPANIMLTTDGLVKVMDFGIARVLGSARMTRAGNLIGTIEYMSPEQVRGQDTDARSDIYSLGMLLYEMLTGRVPFSNGNEYELMKMQIEQTPVRPSEIIPNVPAEIDAAVMRALTKNPDERFQCVNDFRVALCVAGLQLTAPLNTGTFQGKDNFSSGDLHHATPVSNSYLTTAISIENNHQTLLAIATSPFTTAFDVNANNVNTNSSVINTSVKATRLATKQFKNVEARQSAARRLTWKHYAGAGAAVVMLGVVTLAGLSGIFAKRSNVREETETKSSMTATTSVKSDAEAKLEPTPEMTLDATNPTSSPEAVSASNSDSMNNVPEAKSEATFDTSHASSSAASIINSSAVTSTTNAPSAVTVSPKVKSSVPAPRPDVQRSAKPANAASDATTRDRLRRRAEALRLAEQ